MRIDPEQWPKESDSDSANWIRNEDSDCFEDRLSRLEWLVNRTPTEDYWAFGGWLAKSLFEEMRYSFVYAQFLAVVLLGLSYIEISLAASFYQSGRNDLQRAAFSKLLKEALAGGLINDKEFDDLERLRKVRNTYAHFRKPGHDEGIEARSIYGNDQPYGIVEEDGKAVISVAFRLVARSLI